MCLIEQKTYIHSDGHQSTSESTRRCRNAAPNRLCSNIERRTVASNRVVETRPSESSSSSSPDRLLVTQGRDGRERVYRDLSRRSSKRETVRRSNTTSGRTSTEFVTRPTPPTRPSPPNRPFAPLYPPTLPPEPTVVVTAAGTAVYDRPPSLEMPRATENERHRVVRDDRKPAHYYRTIKANALQAVAETPRRRPSLSVNTRSAPGSPSSSSPGLSRLPKPSRSRHDSARETPPLRDVLNLSGNEPGYRPRSDSLTGQRRAYSDIGRTRRDEDDRESRRLADLERERYITRDQLRQSAFEAENRRQSSIEAENRRQAQIAQDRYTLRDQARADAVARQANEDASRDRHLRATAAALEGANRATERELRIAAEYEQLDRERRQSEIRRSQEAQTQAQAQRFASEPPRAYVEARSPPQQAPRGSLHQSISPMSPRTALREPVRTSLTRPILHQNTSARRPSDSIRDKGLEVIAREQQRAVADGLLEPLDRLSIGASDRLQAITSSSPRFEERRPERRAEEPISFADPMFPPTRSGEYFPLFPDSASGTRMRMVDGEVLEEDERVRDEYYHVSDGAARREERFRRREDGRRERRADFFR